MLKNYLTIAIRNILRNKTYSFINIFGLSIGLTCVILISMYLTHEWSYDAFHENKDNICRVMQRTKNRAGEYAYSSQGAIPLGPALHEEIPEVTKYLRYRGPNNTIVRGEDNIIYSQPVLYADPTLFEIFTFPLMEGDAESVLDNPGSVVITTGIAHIYFGDEAPLGKRLTLEIDGIDKDFFVTGVTESPPTNSTIQFNLVVRLDERDNNEHWASGIVQTYVLLDQKTDPAALDDKLFAFTQNHYGSMIASRQNLEGPFAERFGFSLDDDAMIHQLQPLRQVYLHLPWIEGSVARGRPVYSFILAGIALLILLIACINFTTLAIGRSVSRTQEVGIRKVVGAGRVSLIVQFWGEALILVIIAAGLGWLLAEYLTPVFSRLTGQSVDLGVTFGPGTLLAGIFILILTSILAGSYPAAVLSSYQPVSALYGKARGRNRNVFVRGLVTIQFIFSAFFICTTLIMLGQVRFLLTTDTGFNRENIVVLSGAPVANTIGSPGVPEGQENQSRNLVQVLETEMARVQGVIGVTVAPSPATRMGWFMGWVGPDGSERSATDMSVDPSFFDVLELELVEGRYPAPTTSESGYEVVVNETLVKEFGLETPVGGQTLEGFTPDGNDPVIVGVVEDYHFRSLHSLVTPLMLRSLWTSETGSSGVTVSGDPSNILVKIDPRQTGSTLSGIKEVWQEVMPNRPFQYSFLNEDLAALYANESRWASIVTSSSVAALLIACMGLFSLVSLAATRRTKEIGIRKVVGASVTQVVTLLSKEFLVLVLIANVIAWPIAWYAMRRWLENFAYRIDLSWWLFALAGALALIIALATVSWQTIRAATTNPVEALRYE